MALSFVGFGPGLEVVQEGLRLPLKHSWGNQHHKFHHQPAATKFIHGAPLGAMLVQGLKMMIDAIPNPGCFIGFGKSVGQIVAGNVSIMVISRPFIWVTTSV